jgi:8-oxo-dGTP diphosphatase
MPDRVITVVSGVIERDKKYLITQRTEHAVLPLLWEFPGGRVEEGERAEEALTRELDYRLGVVVTIGELLSTTRKDYGTYTVVLQLYSCDIGAQEPEPRSVRDLRWVGSHEFNSYEFPPADKSSMDQLLF